jgi:hypothetical protein
VREAEKLRVSGRIQRFRPDLRRVGEAGTERHRYDGSESHDSFRFVDCH